MNSGVNIIGPVFGAFGIGEDVRNLAKVLQHLAIPVNIVEYPRIGNFANINRDWEAFVSHEIKYDISIFCLPFFEIVRFCVQEGLSLFEAPYNIAYAPWELPVWPSDLAFVEGLFDEIWASSTYTFKAYNHAFSKPIFQIPLVVELPKLGELKPLDWGIPNDRYKYLYVFDSNSSLSRKNPMHAIAAFEKAFDRADPVHLVLKTMHYHYDSPELNAAIADHPQITLINECFDRLTLLRMYVTCNAYLSLHRAEGFGRTIAEAMLLKIPTIVSNYSGNVDFCTPDTAFLVEGSLIPIPPYAYPLCRDQCWFDPDIASAAHQLKQCFTDTAQRDRTLKQAATFISQQFSISGVAPLVQKRLAAIVG